MKYILFAVFENGASIEDLFFELHEKGFNGTYLPSNSINSLTNNDEEPAVLSLRRALIAKESNNPTFFFVLDENDLTKVKTIIEEYTSSFKKIKGAIFASPLTFFEGSF